MPVRAAPHTHHALAFSSSTSSSSFHLQGPRNVTFAYIAGTRTHTFNAHPISRDRPLEKQFDLAARAAGTAVHPPLAAPFYLSLRPAQASDFLPEFDDFAMCPLSHTRSLARLSETQIAASAGARLLPTTNRETAESSGCICNDVRQRVQLD